MTVDYSMLPYQVHLSRRRYVYHLFSFSFRHLRYSPKAIVRPGVTCFFSAIILFTSLTLENFTSSTSSLSDLKGPSCLPVKTCKFSLSILERSLYEQQKESGILTPISSMTSRSAAFW